MIKPYYMSDYSRALGLSLASLNTKKKIQTLTQEVISGKKSDIPKSLNGNLSLINDINFRKKEVNSFQSNLTHANTQLAGMQSSIRIISLTAEHLGPAILSATGKGSNLELQTLLARAPGDLADTISSINITVNDRYIFSGSKTDTPPLLSAQDMISLIKSKIPIPVTAEGIIDTVNFWFSESDTPPGFVDEGYFGSLSDKTLIPANSEKLFEINLTANNKGLRDALKGLILLTLCNDESTTLSNSDINMISENAGQNLITSVSSLSHSRSVLGIVESNVHKEITSLDTELAALELAQSKIVTIDPYEKTTELLAAENEMHNIYMLTSRLYNLNLSDYLK